MYRKILYGKCISYHKKCIKVKDEIDCILCKGDYYLKNNIYIKIPLNCFSYDKQKGCLNCSGEYYLKEKLYIKYPQIFILILKMRKDVLIVMVIFIVKMELVLNVIKIVLILMLKLCEKYKNNYFKLD